MNTQDSDITKQLHGAKLEQAMAKMGIGSSSDQEQLDDKVEDILQSYARDAGYADFRFQLDHSARHIKKIKAVIAQSNLQAVEAFARRTKDLTKYGEYSTEEVIDQQLKELRERS